ncbi:MAG: PEP/pyruvate-binding domain-containing protein [Candidatus Odinarchaeota archaeon]
MDDRTILFFDDIDVSLALAGGKGVNLALLSRSGFKVPPGFIITTLFYDSFVEFNDLSGFITSCLSNLSSDSFDALEEVSKAIRERFKQGTISPELLTGVFSAYHKIGSVPVAVRSSATAEDLADLSFAGQHDTILNVYGDEALKQAIVECLSSLWTARAIDYRNRNGISHKDLALAVIVQQMVDSDSSGVLFTVNPLTGKRSEYVIDATFGLGEALVSGQIEPDHYVVDSTTGKILLKEVGSKKVSIHGQEGGGTVTVDVEASDRESLSVENISALVQLGKSVAALYSSPQDIEWAFAGDNLLLLQSRPVTSLYPLPEEFLSGPIRVCLSFGLVQGMLDPITPLGQVNIILFLMGLAKTFGYKPSLDNQTFIWSMGNRLWFDLSFMLRNRGLKSVALKIPALIEPASQQIFEQLVSEPWISPRKRPHVKAFRRGTRLMLFMMRKIRAFILDPRGERLAKQALVNDFVMTVERESAKLQTFQQKISYYRRVMDAAAGIVFLTVAPAIPAGYGPLLVLNHLASGLTGDNTLVLELTRSLPYNPTTEMNLLLGEMADRIKNDPAAYETVLQTTAEELASDFKDNQLPLVVQQAVTDFLAVYGMRGLAEIDMGRPRWKEDPVPVFSTLKNYISLIDEQKPAKQFQRGLKSVNEAYRKLFFLLKKSKGGKLKAKFLNAAIIRVRGLSGLREYPKFTMMRVFWIIRNLLLQSGEDCVKEGILEKASDIFFLHYRELEQLAAGEKEEDWKSLVKKRRESYQREKHRKLIPRVILSDGRVFHEGLGSKSEKNGTTLVGSPVSPGVIEGTVRIIFDPQGSELEPGEILVCTATDPSWTPLFLVAGGLILETGGFLQHGAVVAREHNIPAVVGVNQATIRLKTGQRIRVNGTTGQIEIIEG